MTLYDSHPFVMHMLGLLQAREKCEVLSKRCEEYSKLTSELQAANYELSQVGDECDDIVRFPVLSHLLVVLRYALCAAAAGCSKVIDA